MSWNGFPITTPSKIKCWKSDVIDKINNNKENETEIFFCLLYAGSKGEKLVKHCLKNIRRCLKINVKLVDIYDTNKVLFYCNVKDKAPHEHRNNIIYSFMFLKIVRYIRFLGLF